MSTPTTDRFVRRWPLALPILLLLFLPAVAHAGAVYVVMASDGMEDGLHLETEVLVTNTRPDSVTVDMLFIPTFRDGIERMKEEKPTSVVVPPFKTMLFDGLTDGTRSGILQVSAPKRVVVSARLASRKNGETDWTPIPVIGSNEMLAAGEFHVLAGWRRDARHRTGFGIVNLAEEASFCEVQVVAADGSGVLPKTEVKVAARSLAYFADAVLAVGRKTGRDLRAQVECDKPAFSYSLVRNRESGAIQTLLPAADAVSTLRADLTPDTEPPAPQPGADCETGSYCFEVAGEFHVPTRSKPVVHYRIPAPKETFSSVRVQMEVVHGGWSKIDPAGLHGFFWLYRNGIWRGNTFGYVNARGPARNILANLTNVNLSAGVTAREKTGVDLVPGRTYLLDYVYDTGSGVVRTELLRPNGTVVAKITDSTTANRIRVEGGFEIEVGLHRGPVEVPSYGWRYRDLLVTFSP